MSGKARKGDANDLTPNPTKLQSIGKELDKLNRSITEMAPVSELPFNVRPNTRKEKNKLVSRACRLKKKAQHEANKIKLFGLETEHRHLINAIAQVKQILLARKTSGSYPKESQELTNASEKIAKNATRLKVAGQTTEFSIIQSYCFPGNKTVEENPSSDDNIEELLVTSELIDQLHKEIEEELRLYNENIASSSQHKPDETLISPTNTSTKQTN
ncbi:hypothetical protein ACI65C_006538 [Semiaphis heraclei]